MASVCTAAEFGAADMPGDGPSFMGDTTAPSAATAPGDSLSASARARSMKIAQIIFVNNTRTKDRVIQLFLALDTGMVYRATAVDSAELRLRRTGIFFKVKILRSMQRDGVRLFVVVTEMPRVLISDIGGNAHLADVLYGEPETFWRLWRVDLGVKLYNMRGVMESLTLQGQILEWRSLILTWRKPFLGSPYGMSLGAGVYSYPYTDIPWRSLTAKGQLAGTCQLGDRASMYLGVYPLFNRLQYEGPADSGRYSSWRARDSATVAVGPGRTDREHDRSWLDTVRVNPDSLEVHRWKGNPTWERDQASRRLYELYTSLGASIRRTNDDYPFSKGWYGRADLGVNIPSHQDSSARAYVQLDGDLRFYHRAWPRGTTLAYRALGTLRDSDGGRFHFLEAGGESTIRGYGSGTLGDASRANDRFLFSTEYRFPMYTTAAVRLPGIAAAFLPTRDVHYRFDGAVFVDHAYMWHTLEHPLTRYEDAWAFGAGLRIMLPPVRRAVVIDIAPLEVYNGKAVWGWGWNFYVDLQI